MLLAACASLALLIPRIALAASCTADASIDLRDTAATESIGIDGFVRLAKDTGLLDFIDTAPDTDVVQFFAPSNGALAAFFEALGDVIFENPEAMMSVLAQHVGVSSTCELGDGELGTLEGYPLVIKGGVVTDPNGNEANIVNTLATEHGLVHVIDWALLPYIASQPPAE